MSSDRIVQARPMQIPNTMALPCAADLALEYRGPNQLADVQSLYDRHGSIAVLGGASNVILPPKLSRPVVLMKSQGIDLVGQTDNHWLVDVAAGENWHGWVQTSLDRGWSGLENLALIPGSVGAAPVQNIGAYGVELVERLDALEIWDFERRCRRWLSVAQCRFAYRDSVFKHEEGRHWLVLTVRFALPRAWRPVLDYPDLRALTQGEAAKLTPRDVFDLVVSVRQAKLPDPAIKPNVGSFFKNPVVCVAKARELIVQFPALVSYDQPDGQVKLAAGWMIDQCGLKGMRMGPVAVHDRQALVLVNNGGASADDVIALANAIASAVHTRFGVMLEMEPSRWLSHE